MNRKQISLYEGMGEVIQAIIPSSNGDKLFIAIGDDKFAIVQIEYSGWTSYIRTLHNEFDHHDYDGISSYFDEKTIEEWQRIDREIAANNQQYLENKYDQF